MVVECGTDQVKTISAAFRPKLFTDVALSITMVLVFATQVHRDPFNRGLPAYPRIVNQKKLPQTS